MHQGGVPDAEIFAETYKGEAPDIEAMLEDKE